MRDCTSLPVVLFITPPVIKPLYADTHICITLPYPPPTLWRFLTKPSAILFVHQCYMIHVPYLEIFSQKDMSFLTKKSPTPFDPSNLSKVSNTVALREIYPRTRSRQGATFCTYYPYFRKIVVWRYGTSKCGKKSSKT